MKATKFFMGMLGAFALAACSAEDPINNGATIPDLTDPNSFISVSIEMPTAPGTRAEGVGDNESDKFENGTEKESSISNLVFFFFSEDKTCIDIKKLLGSSLEHVTTPTDNPYVEKVGTVSVPLKPGKAYKNGYVAVAINVAEDEETLRVKVTNENAFFALRDDYAAEVANDGSNQLMSNTVYYNTSDYSDNPTEDDKECLVQITEKNIYTSADDIDHLIANGEKDYVNIYVERAAARVDVDVTRFNIDNFSITQDGEKVTTLKVWNHQTSKFDEITVKPEIIGISLNVMSPSANLIKDIDVATVGYGIGDGAYNSFKWNDPLNKRSYWCKTSLATGESMKYFSWEYVEDNGYKGKEKFTTYINPNSLAYKPIKENEGSSDNTKVMVVATLNKHNGEDKEAVSLVRYGSIYMLKDNFTLYTADHINTAVRTIDWSKQGLKDGNADLTTEQLKAISTAVNNAFLGTGEGNDFKGVSPTKLDITLMNPKYETVQGENDEEVKNLVMGDNDWKSKVSLIGEVYDSYSLDISGINASVIAQVKEKVNSVIDATLEDINSIQLLYWKDGKTYYYTKIRHQGFYGLVGGDSDNFLYGVVRNHIYKVSITGIYGLGTPVIDPGLPINPDRPNNDDSYIMAKISILPWRVVKQDAIIH